ncbi:MAG: NAD-dependent epimerase/dehydratase family protein [Chitinophagaceae bacterium]|nr:MAG: NAD-dependent epimerase/dehydratase family protein [Chitinophagaceae bacterium]
MEKKRILLTGMAGFIGFGLAEKLAKENAYEVVGLDNINDYYDVKLKFDRLSQLGFDPDLIQDGKLVQSKKHDGFQFVKLDLENLTGLQEVFAAHRFDMVIHLAAQAGVRHSLKNPHAYINSNVTGFVNILECSKIHTIKHLVYASSSSVYGIDSAVPFSENEPANHPVSLYAATKRMNELMAFTYNDLYQLPVTGLRFFTVYGPWGRPDMSPMLFAKSIIEGKAIKVFNYGKMRRDFTFIDDIVEGIKKVIERPAAGYKIYNIGNSKPVDLMNFIQLIENAIGKEAIKEMLPMQPGEVYETYADTTLLSNDTGYKPSTPLSEGVQKFLSWYLNYYK